VAGEDPAEERLIVTKTFACRDVGVPCRAKVSGATEEEVLAKAVEHAKERHGVDLTVSQTLVKFAKSKVRDEGAAMPSGSADAAGA
jgi:predicted small metal-binding protein